MFWVNATTTTNPNAILSVVFFFFCWGEQHFLFPVKNYIEKSKQALNIWSDEKSFGIRESFFIFFILKNDFDGYVPH